MEEEQQRTKKERLQQQREEKNAKKEQVVKKQSMMRNGIAAAIAVVIIAFIWMLSSSGGSTDTVVDVSPDPSTGPVEATVLVEEYADFQCPACASAAPAAKAVLEKYGDTVRFEYNDFPLPQHDYGVTAAIAGECAFQQDFFFPFHDVVFEQQDTWSSLSSKKDVEDLFIEYATEVGMDVDQFLFCTSSDDTADRVNEDVSEARSVGVNSTPSFFVNGERIGTGAISVALPEAIDAVLAQ